MWVFGYVMTSIAGTAQAILIQGFLMNLRFILDVLVVMLAGTLVPLQTAFNTQFARAAGGPLISAIVVFVVGLVVTIGLAVAMRTTLPTIAQITAVPPLAWLAGGLCAVAYLTILMVMAPRVGAVAVVAFVVVGQVACSALIDHYGWLGFDPHPLNVQRVLGLVLLVAGATLVRLY